MLYSSHGIECQARWWLNIAVLFRLVKESVAHWGTVDVLVNNAGITRDTLVMRMKPEQWQSVIDTNLSAVFYASQVSHAPPQYQYTPCSASVSTYTMRLSM